MLNNGSYKSISNANLKVGDIIRINSNERIPADMVLLYTTEKGSSIFIRTDQLDGETDWKLRKPIGHTQRSMPPETIINMDGKIIANPPNNLIYDFKGVYHSDDSESCIKEPLSLENTLWANTVLASSGFILA